jgi:hypothetical protein
MISLRAGDDMFDQAGSRGIAEVAAMFILLDGKKYR